MKINHIDELNIHTEMDIIDVRQRVRSHSAEAGLSLVDQTKLVTATSELVRNMYCYAGGGCVAIARVTSEKNTGIRLTFADEGPGIADIDLAMQDGYSTGKSMGLGLPGARRLVNEFEIKSSADQGTKITVVKWK